MNELMPSVVYVWYPSSMPPKIHASGSKFDVPSAQRWPMEATSDRTISAIRHKASTHGTAVNYQCQNKNLSDANPPVREQR